MKDQKVIKYSEQLRKLGIEHEFLEHPPMVDVNEIYQYYGLSSSAGFSTLIMKADDKFVAIIRRDDTKLDFDKARKVLGVNNLKVATEEEFTKLVNLPVGAAHVLNPGLKTYLDSKLFEKDYLLGGCGSLSVSCRYKTSDLKKIPEGFIVDISTVVEKVIINGKRLYSAITPSGDGTLHIGNYLGAVKQFVELAKNNECFFQIADIHALTTVQNKAQLQKNVETLILNELALLGDLTNICFARQSDIGLHTELQSIINNVTPLGLIKRAHAYKDKLAKDMMEDDINLGLFNYPILMAADILIYKTQVVPVGKDQKQHVEIARDIADKFNKIFKKKVFPLPDAYIPEEVAAVLGTDGKRKMSKSLGNIISIFESEEVIRKQVNSTYTDPTRAHATDPGHIEGNMVFSYLDFFGNKQEVISYKQKYIEGKVSDMEVKEYLFESLMKTFAPARKRYEELKANPKLVKEILEKGAEKARKVAGETMKEVREVIGLTNKYSLALSNSHGILRYAQNDNKNVQNDNKNAQNDNKNVQGDNGDGKITIDDFSRVEVRVGKVVKAENVEKSEKLIRLTVDFDKFGQRIIFTGVRGYGYTAEDFIGKKYLFVVNLEYRKMLSEESQGMILAVDGLELPFGQHGSVKPLFISAEGLPVGSKVR